MVESATIQLQSSIAKGGVIVYVQSQKQFAYYVGGKYYGNWAVEGVPNAELYRGEDVSSIQKTRFIFVVMFSMFGAMKKMTLLKSVAAVAVTRTM